MRELNVKELESVSGGNDKKPDNCEKKTNPNTGGDYYECEGIIFTTCHSIKNDGSKGARVQCP